MSKSLHPRALDLRIWASKLERNLLAPEEAQYIAMLLRRVAEGGALDEVLGVKRGAHRPYQNAIHHYVEQIYGLMQPPWDGKPGLSVTEAISTVAKWCNKSIATVKTAYYSEAGKAHLQAVQAALRDPFA